MSYATRQWESIADPDCTEVHVHPLGDLIAHDIAVGAADRCVCVPSPELVATDHGDAYIYTHHSLDGREWHE